MKRRTNPGLLAVTMAIALFALGCAEAPPAQDQGVGLAPPSAPAPPAEPVENTETRPSEPAEAADSTAPVVDENTETKVAEVGFGEKGHYDSKDYISVAVSTKFRVEEQIGLLRIKNCMDQYKAINGKFPKDHEEFWKEIIEKNSIQLPDLPPGQRFLYDPELAKETRGEKSLKILVPKKS